MATLMHATAKTNWFCDKLPTSVKPWDVPDIYGPEDLAVSIFTGERIMYSRAAALVFDLGGSRVRLTLALIDRSRRGAHT